MCQMNTRVGHRTIEYEGITIQGAKCKNSRAYYAENGTTNDSIRVGGGVGLMKGFMTACHWCVQSKRVHAGVMCGMNKTTLINANMREAISTILRSRPG